MKKCASIITIIAVFAILSLSIHAIPLYTETHEATLSTFDLDPIVEQAIDREVNEALSNVALDEDELTNLIEIDSSVNSALTDSEVTVNQAKLIVSDNHPREIRGYVDSAESPLTKLVIGSKGDSSDYLSIGEGAFRDCTTLTEIDLSESVITSIDMAAFYGCTALRTVKLPSTIENIGGYAFINTPWLTNKRKWLDDAKTQENTTKLVVVNNILIDGITAEDWEYDSVNELSGVVVDHVKIAPYAFSYNNKIKNLVISHSTIGYRSFANCKKLKNVTMESVGEIGISAFANDAALVEITADSELSVIKSYAFDACSNLTIFDLSVTSLQTIDTSAFKNCKSYVGRKVNVGTEEDPVWHTEIIFPGALTYIGVAAFTGCSAIKEIQFVNPDNDDLVIDQAAFAGCTRLNNNVIIADGKVVDIKNYAFDN